MKIYAYAVVSSRHLDELTEGVNGMVMKAPDIDETRIASIMAEDKVSTGDLIWQPQGNVVVTSDSVLFWYLQSMVLVRKDAL
jgi:hypothetical protein